ncbi:MAG: GMC family oxidoreductase [Candidatus Marinimicrobia bacterium]|nr:GMC family oxidoreductase [Candidatus Neomarinimicrobiota bacterium]MEE1573288.1 GMC family oxidoreductase [Candidatus Neomarinimicrobiota bacterium]
MASYYDYIIIGSGFGGSVSALRLAEKGYKVAVIEQGKRYQTKDFPKTNWNLKKYLWFPKLYLFGIQALTLLKDVFIFHGTGVGGGSLVYANNLLIPPDDVLNDPAWGIKDWKEKIAPFYKTAQKMLGATPSKMTTHADELLKSCANDIGRGDTFHINDVGIFFGKEKVTVSDPYFSGKGPERTGCTFCGGCMVGCRIGAKNTLDKNYLYLAEQLGVKIIPETTVRDVKPSQKRGYSLTTKKLTKIFSSPKIYHADNVIFSGGVMGSVKLLLRCKNRGSLPNLSDQLGNFVRTNSEALVGVKANTKEINYSKGIAITSGIYPDEHTHIETVRYGAGQDALAGLSTVLVGDGPRWPRFIYFLGTALRHPVKFLKSLNVFGWARKTTILLVMQKTDNYLRFDYKPRWWRLGIQSMNSNCDTEKKVPSYIPVANDFAKRMAKKVNGEPLSILPEVLFNTSSTAHILGGCVMSENQEKGVIDHTGEIHGYKGLYVVDGSIVPVNLSVNPSLTITAMAEYIMSKISDKSS